MSDWNRTPDSLDPTSASSGDSGSGGRVSISPWVEAEGLPSWLRPFSLDSNTRFTRTPDSLIRARSKGRDGVISPLPPLGMPDMGLPEAVLPEGGLAQDGFSDGMPLDAVLSEIAPPAEGPPVHLALPDDLAEDEVFIDWTGGSWAARQAISAAEPDLSPVDGDGQGEGDSPIEVVGGSSDLSAAEDSADDSVMTVLAEPETACIAEPVPEQEPVAELPAELIETSEAVTDRVPVPGHILRLAGLILVDPVHLPRAETDQDLAPRVEAAVEPIAEAPAVSAETSSIETSCAETSCAESACAEIAAAEAEGLLAELAGGLSEDRDQEQDQPDTAPEAPISASQTVDMEPPAEPLAAAPAAPLPSLGEAMAPPPFFGWGMSIGAALGWPMAGMPVPEAPSVPAIPVAQETRAQETRAQEARAQDTLSQDTRSEQVRQPDAPAPEAPAAPALPASLFGAYDLPPLELLAEPPESEPDFALSEEALDRNSAVLQQTLRDFGVRGEVIDANPGPVVTLYEFEPAPGTKSSRVIGLSADIARSMSAVSTRVAVVEGRNVIGIELPNQRRQTVWLRELLADQSFADARGRLGIALGKTIGGEPVIADLARMPHLLVAGTTGSGKSVAINTMILSLLYRLTPEQCRLIMIDPKMLELSVYEGIPHLLTPVVTDPKKAIIALQWAVREMEDRYRKMARLKVRNIEGFNARVAEAREKGEVITFTVDKGFDKETGETLVEEATLDLTALPYIVIIVDEMADLMMVAGKDIEGAIQRLAQMARAAGIHLVMATQRPSVDVITGTIKANFPTRISFQVTSKIDSRTILGEMGAETLLGQGDMLYMANGGRITRVHGPFVSDGEVEHVVAHLKAQGRPEYLDAVTAAAEEEEADEDSAVFDRTALGAEDGGDHYEQAVALVMRDRKASTSYIQRRLQIGYNKAASLMERMEQEGIVGAANHAGKREILAARPA
ncbi:DNA translocase FtsK [Aquabacter cavernae]|uniref:DNA translocase FtsK n=1 Tax=Aquabacter cavernae TaxID=2496029 RepID=UPI001FE0B47B|nr:DNA translocase FtsK [Aquabacter cavernae]